MNEKPMSLRDTPRTDQKEAIECGDAYPMIEFARQLERELNSAKAELMRLRDVVCKEDADSIDRVLAIEGSGNE